MCLCLRLGKCVCVLCMQCYMKWMQSNVRNMIAQHDEHTWICWKFSYKIAILYKRQLDWDDFIGVFHRNDCYSGRTRYNSLTECHVVTLNSIVFHCMLRCVVHCLVIRLLRNRTDLNLLHTQIHTHTSSTNNSTFRPFWKRDTDCCTWHSHWLLFIQLTGL